MSSSQNSQEYQKKSVESPQRQLNPQTTHETKRHIQPNSLEEKIQPDVDQDYSSIDYFDFQPKYCQEVQKIGQQNKIKDAESANSTAQKRSSSIQCGDDDSYEDADFFDQFQPKYCYQKDSGQKTKLSQESQKSLNFSTDNSGELESNQEKNCGKDQLKRVLHSKEFSFKPDKLQKNQGGCFLLENCFQTQAQNSKLKNSTYLFQNSRNLGFIKSECSIEYQNQRDSNLSKMQDFEQLQESDNDSDISSEANETLDLEWEQEEGEVQIMQMFDF